MSTRFSIPGAPLISDIIPSTFRSSRVAGTQLTGVPTGGVRTSTVIAGGPPAYGVRGSRVINPSEIPPGAEIIRVENPPEYIYHNAPTYAQTARTVMRNDVGVPPPRPHRSSQMRARTSSWGPWWCWLLFGLLALLLLAGIIFGCLRIWGGNQRGKGKGGETVVKRTGGRNQGQVVQAGQADQKIRRNQDNQGQRNQGVNRRATAKQHPLEPALLSQNNPSNTGSKVSPQRCQVGFFVHNGRCIKCPQGSFWNGANCIEKEGAVNNQNPAQSNAQRRSVDGAGSNSGQEPRPQEGGGNRQQTGQESSPPPQAPEEQHPNPSNAGSENPPERPDQYNNSKGQKADRDKAAQQDRGQGDRNAEQPRSPISDATSGISSNGPATVNDTSNLWEEAKSLGRGAAETAGYAASSAWEGARSFGKSAMNVAGDAAKMAGDAASSMWQGLKDVGRVFTP